MKVWWFDQWKKVVGIILLLVVVALGFVWRGAVWLWIDEHEPLTAAIVVIVGWIWAWRTLEAMRRDRSSEIAKNLWEYWDSGTLLEARKTIWQILIKKGKVSKTIKHWEESYPEDFFRLLSIPNYFELVGWLVKHRCIKLKSILKLLESPIVFYYEQYEEYIEQVRRKEVAEAKITPRRKLKRRKPTTYEYFIWLEEKARRNSHLPLRNTHDNQTSLFTVLQTHNR